MKKLYIICGYPFSGKTTLVKALQNHRKVPKHIINLDEIMTQRGIDVSKPTTVEQWEETHQIALMKMEEIMNLGEDIILDDTNFLFKLRERWRQKAIPFGYEPIVILVKTPKEEIFRRIDNNLKLQERHDVQKKSVLNVINNFEFPTFEEKSLILEINEDITVWLNKNIV